ncbi:hypothetical protein T484DRAFT_2105766 [Baffinella frigidus]|nr:hypothetical protein T484DRAFT_2105766 [Cryptophyta sp. CCMP2293]
MQETQLPAMCPAPPSLPAVNDAATDAARTEVRIEPPPVPVPLTTPDASRSQAQQDNAEDSAGDADSLATRVNSSGFVDEVTPRRRGNEQKVVLTRELLESFYHLPLDTVAEHLVLSKTTIKAACRRLGLPKWPYQHTGPRKRRVRVPRPEQAAASEHGHALKATFHDLMGNTNAPTSAKNVSFKRQRIGEEQGMPLTSPPAATLESLQEMQRQSLLALSAMVSALSASDQQISLNPPFQGQAFPGQAPPPWTPVHPKP